MSRDDVSLQILRRLVVDGLLISGLVLCCLATEHLWPPYQRGFFCNDETLLLPYHGDTVSVPVLRIVGIFLPMIAFLICEWALLRKEQEEYRCLGISIPTWARGFYSVLCSFSLGMCFIELATNISKCTIGRLRPHFFQICQPSVDCSSPLWSHRYVYPHEYNCTNEDTSRHKDMRMSFMSGHSAWSAYTMVYLAFYLEKRMTWHCTRTLRHTLQFAVIMISWFIALSRVSDFKHHWSDVLAGYFSGILCAVLIWTWGTELVMKKKKHTSVLPNDISLITQHHANITAQPA